jgi:hypothetical protein
MVRIWQEDDRTSDQVKISAESIQTGQSFQFKTTNALLDFIAAQIDAANTAYDDSLRQTDSQTSDME